MTNDPFYFSGVFLIYFYEILGLNKISRKLITTKLCPTHIITFFQVLSLLTSSPPTYEENDKFMANLNIGIKIVGLDKVVFLNLADVFFYTP